MIEYLDTSIDDEEELDEFELDADELGLVDNEELEDLSHLYTQDDTHAGEIVSI